MSFLDIHQHTIPRLCSYVARITMSDTPTASFPRRSPRKHNEANVPEDAAARRELKFNKNMRKNVAPSDDALDDDDDDEDSSSDSSGNESAMKKKKADAKAKKKGKMKAVEKKKEKKHTWPVLKSKERRCASSDDVLNDNK